MVIFWRSYGVAILANPLDLRNGGNIRSCDFIARNNLNGTKVVVKEKNQNNYRDIRPSVSSVMKRISGIINKNGAGGVSSRSISLTSYMSGFIEFAIKWIWQSNLPK